MYDDNSPQMNREPEIAISDDPHGVLHQIADVDREILNLRKMREKLLVAYQAHMKGIEEHWNSVMSGPEPPIEEVPVRNSDDEAYNLYQAKRRAGW